jgi:ABC-type sugar transport system ATPase subunit
MATTIFEFCNIEKTFFGIKALKGVSLSLAPGKTLGLIGQNGAGKSTLMNVMGGVVRPESGCMLLDGKLYEPWEPRDAVKAGIGFIHQELNLFTNLTVEENIFIDNFPRRGLSPFISKSEIRTRTAKLLKELELDISPRAIVESLSPGERQLVEIAKALSSDARIIIFDEPTTSLTARETERLFSLMRHLRTKGVSLVYISHILGDVVNLADDIAVLRDGALVAQGPVVDFSIPRMITAMVGRDFDNIFPDRKNKPSLEPALRIEGLSQTGIVKDIDLVVRKGEVVGVFGLMGSGRTELARMIFGLDRYETGLVFVGDNQLRKNEPPDAIRSGIGFVTENRREEGLLMPISISENIGLVSLDKYTAGPLGFVDRKAMYTAAGSAASELKVKAGSLEKQSVKSLSGGNQQKVVIAKWVLSGPSVLIMDEPTRGIDVAAKFEVYTIMNDLAVKGTGVLFISSEIEELIGVADRIVVMSRGEIIRSFSREEFNQEDIMRAAFRQQVSEGVAV